MGHSIENNLVTKHSYLSTSKVIDDLKVSNESYEQGHVVIRSVERNSDNGQISKFVVYW